jgi:hypothetical protein
MFAPHRLLLALVFLVGSPIASAAGDPRGAGADPCDAKFPATIDGVLTRHQEFGPPGWGEDPSHDSRWSMPVLTLSASSRRLAKSLLPECGSEPGAETDEVQLWFHPDSDSWKHLVGKHVQVTGSFHFPSGAPAELLDVQFDVTAILLK